MKILVTGGAGFFGHHLVEHILKTTDWDIVVLDKLTYASNGLERLRDINCFNINRVLILNGDFSKPLSYGVMAEIGQIDYIVHAGAETHVDRSIENPEPFVISNVLGTMYMLEFAKTQEHLKKFIMFSTDEVFGPAPQGTYWHEYSRYHCTNPYAASKAGAEQLCVAYKNCYKVPVTITNTMNIFGERQHSEKFIPSTINKILKGELVTIHADSSRAIAGTRFYIHARNVASAIMHILNHCENFPRINIVGEKEVDNLTLAKTIAKILGKPLDYDMVDFHSSRPGHDLRYALDGKLLKDLGWNTPLTFEQSLESTVHWTLVNQKWLR